MRRRQSCLALMVMLLLATYSAGQEQIVLTYDPSVGNLTLQSDRLITALEIKSEAGIFTNQRPEVLDGRFDVYNPNKIFILEPEGVDEIDYGPAVAPNLLADEFVAGTCVNGAHLPTGWLDPAFLQYGDETYPLSVCKPVEPPPPPRPVALYYDPNTGEIRLDIDEVQTDGVFRDIQILSQSSIFTNQVASQLEGPNDIDAHNRIAKKDVAGFGDINFGLIAQTGLDVEFVASDLCVTGRWQSPFRSIGAVALNGDPEILLGTCTSFPRPPVTPPEFTFAPPGNVGLHYEPDTGQLSLNVREGVLVQEIEIRSERSIFSGSSDSGASLRGSRVSKTEFPGFNDTTLGSVADLGLSSDLLLEDLCITGLLSTGVTIGPVHLNSDETQLLPCSPPPPPPPTPDVSVNYDAETGAVSVDMKSFIRLQALKMESESGIFNGPGPVAGLTGPFDVLTGEILTKIGRFRHTEFGLVAGAGLTDEMLLADLCVNASELTTGPLIVAHLNGNMDQPLETCSPIVAPPPIDPNLGVALVYDPTTGDLRLVTDGTLLTTLELQSPELGFTGEPTDDFNGLFDVFTDDKIFKLDPAGFDSLFMPGALPPGLTAGDLATIAIGGSRIGVGGALDSGNPFVITLLPEPSSGILAAFAWLGFVCMHRSWRSGQR